MEERGGVFIRRNIAHPTAIWSDLPPPSSLLPMVLADPGFASPKPKLPPPCLVPIYAEKSGSTKPRSSPVPLFPSLHNPQAGHGTVVRTQLSWT